MMQQYQQQCLQIQEVERHGQVGQHVVDDVNVPMPNQDMLMENGSHDVVNQEQAM